MSKTEIFHELFSLSLFSENEDISAFRRKIDFFIPIGKDSQIKSEKSFPQILFATREFNKIESNKIKVFLDEYNAALVQYLEDDGNIEPTLEKMNLSLDQLLIALSLKLHLTYDNKDFYIGRTGEILYFMYDNNEWCLSELIFSHIDTTSVKIEPSLILPSMINPLNMTNDDELVPEDKNSASLNMFNVIKDHISNIISKIDALQDLRESLRNQLILSITTSTFSLITSITTLAIENVGRTTKVINCANIAGSLTTLVHGVYASLKMYDNNFNVQQALSVIPSSIEVFQGNIKDVSNSSDGALHYIKPAISAIVAVIVAGLTTVGGFNAKDIIKSGNLSKAYREIATNVNGVVDFVIQDICQMDINGDKIINKELIDLAIEAGELAITPVYKFCTDPPLKNSLLTFQKRYQDIASKRFKDVVNSKAAMSAKTTINGLMTQLIGLIKAVKDVSEQCGRQETVAIMLAGRAGIGKSTLIKPLQKSISDILGYKNESYDLTKETPDKFYTTYGGQPYGVVNEFMGTSMRNDGFLKSFNKIVSGDHVNLEGSGLEQKYQPADFKVVFLTSNDLCPNLVGDEGLKQSTAEAVWSRTIRVLVEDPKFEGRMGNNTHRQKDNSHLMFKIVSPKYQNETNSTNVEANLINISYSDLKDLLIEQIAKREINFLQNIQRPEVNGQPLITNPEDNKTVEDRILALEKLLTKSNSLSKAKEFFVVRLQGMAGVGKTRLASIISGTIAKFRKIGIYNISDFSKQSCSEQGIYIIDDLLYSHREKLKYLSWMNCGHPNNLYIVCSNTIYKTNEKTWINTLQSKITGALEQKYFDVEKTDDFSFPIPSGYYRRIGLSGSVKIPGEDTLQNSSRNNIFINFDINGNLAMNGSAVSQESCLNHIYIMYLSFLKNCNEIITTEDMAPSTLNKFDVQIISPNVEQLCTALSTPYNIKKTIVVGFKETKIILASDFIKDVKAFVTESDWVIPKNAETDTEREQLFIRMIRSLQKICEKPTVLVRVGSYNWVYSGGIIYKQSKYNSPELVFKNGLVYYKNMCVTPKMYCGFLNAELENLHSLQITDIDLINNFIDNLPAKSKQIYLFQKSLIKDQNTYSLTLIKYYEKFRNNKYVWVAAGLCGLVSTGTLIYKLLPKKEDNKFKIKSNSADYENHALTKVTQRYIKAVMNGEHALKAQIKQEAFDAGQGPAFNQWEYEWRTAYDSNSSTVLYDPQLKDKDSLEMVKAILKSEDEEAKIAVVRDYPHYLTHVKSNMLTDDEERFSERNIVDKFRHSLLKNFVLVQPNKKSFHYGMGYSGKHILTVSHGIDDGQKTVQISSNGKQYTAHVVSINRARDLAQLYISDKTFPEFKDLTKKILYNTEMRQITDFWYVRVSAKDSVMASVEATFLESSAIPRSDPNNPNYQLQEAFFRINFFRADIKKLIRDGDCGMPLIGFRNNEPYIIGMHNGYTGYGVVLFASLDLETFQVLNSTAVANNGAVDQNRVILHPIMKKVCSIDPQYRKALLKDPEPSRFTQGDLAPLGVIGFYKDLYIVSNPKHKKIFHRLPEAKTKCETMPSCITFIKNITNPAPLKKDMHGNPHTLFTQAFKYSVKTEEYSKKLYLEYPEEINYTLEMLKFRIKTMYGDFRTINNKEILNGMEYLKPFDITTSCGPALKMQFGITNKTKLLKNMNPNIAEKPFYIFDETPEALCAKKQYNEYKTSIEDGIPIFVVSKNNAKVELLPSKDVLEKSKVRLFNELDFSLNLVLRHYFGFAINKIMEKCGRTPYCIGANNYTIATDIMMSFNLMEGQHQSSDYSSFDKSLCKEIIGYFISVFCEYAGPKVVEALTKTMQYTMHILEGHVYYVDHGNESGSVVTTLLNCFAQDFIDTFTAIRLFKLEMGHLPSYSQLSLLYKAFYLGDDGALKVSYPAMTMEERKISAAMFNMKLTPPKVLSEYVSFCSREFIPDNKSMIYFPRLKKSSITSCLYYFERDTNEQVIANINVALFEASFHERPFFEDIKHDVISLARKYGIAEKVLLYSYEEYRNRFREYLLREETSPILLTIGGQKNHKILNIIQNENLSELNQDINTLEQNTTFSNFAKIMENKNYCELLKELCDKHNLDLPVLVYSKTGGDEAPTWECSTSYVVEAERKSFEAKGFTKSSAKHRIYEDIYKALRQEKENSIMKANNGNKAVMSFEYGYDKYCELYSCRLIHQESKRVMQVVTGHSKRDVRNKILRMYFDEIPFEYTDRCVKEQMKIAQIICEKLNLQNIYVYVDRKTVKIEDDIPKMCDNYRYLENNGKVMCLSATSQTFNLLQIKEFYEDYNVKTSADGLFYSLGEKSNMEREIAPDAIRGTAVNQQMSTVPIGQMNPQPTGQVMALAPAGQDAINAIEAIKHQTLNPMGAPNMSTVGAVMFTLPQLCYTQFLDADKEYIVTDQSPSGTIIFQIPYDPLSEFVNPYIKQWVSLHERYQGALEFRITVVGNPMFSGFIGVSWQPNRYNGTTIPISELQKYAYDSKGVTLPWSEVHTLHDARQDLFYRTINDNDDISKRPHLVVALVASLQNPLKENAQVRIRLASKLSNNPSSFFTSFKPILGLSPGPPPTTIFKVSDIFPDTGSMYLVADGRNTYLQDAPFTVGQEFNRTLMQNTSTKAATDLNASDPFFISSIVLDRNDETLYFFDTIPQAYGKMRIGIMLSTNYNNFNKELANMLYNSAGSDKEMATYFKEEKWVSCVMPNTTIYSLTPVSNINNTGSTTRIFKQLFINSKEGNAIISFVGYAYEEGSQYSNPTLQYPLDAYGQKVAPYGQFTIAGVVYSDGANTIPTGYTALQLSTSLERVPNFSINTVTAPSVVTPSKFRREIQAFLKRLEITTNTVDADLYDNVNNVLVASIRFTPQYTFIRSLEVGVYKSFNQNIINFEVRNVRGVEVGDVLPPTDVSTWLNRQPTTLADNDIDYIIEAMKKRIDIGLDTKANAGIIAAGALQGLGQGIGQFENFNFQKFLQQNAFEQQRIMQNGFFDGQLRLKGATTEAELFKQQSARNQPTQSDNAQNFSVNPNTGELNNNNLERANFDSNSTQDLNQPNNDSLINNKQDIN